MVDFGQSMALFSYTEGCSSFGYVTLAVEVLRAGDTLTVTEEQYFAGGNESPARPYNVVTVPRMQIDQVGGVLLQVPRDTSGDTALW